MNASNKTSTRGMEPPPHLSKALRSLIRLPLVLIGIAMLATSTFLLWFRVKHLNQEMVLLSIQLQEVRRETVQSAEKSEAAFTRASQAEENAFRAAQPRDAAELARAKSEKLATEAQERVQAATHEAAQARLVAEQFRRERQAELDRLQGILGEIANTRRTAMGLVMTLGSNSIRFDFDKATLRPENREILSRIADVLMTLKGYQIYVYGYTDYIGTEQYNQRLSEQRAEAVRYYLVKAGLNPNIISTKGYGEADPLFGGTSAMARAKNRRVEIGIVDSVLRMQGLADSASTRTK